MRHQLARRVWPTHAPEQRGFALPLVLVTFLLVGVMGLGVFSVVMSDLHGSVANQLAMEVLNVAEAGADYAINQMYVAALANPPTDDGYAGASGPITLGRGSFQVIVRCGDGTVPSLTVDGGCADDRDLRHVISTGTIGRARRQIELWVRRTTPGGDFSGVCGRDGVQLDQGTTITADVASNRDINVEGPRRNPGSIRARDSLAPAPTSWATAGGSGSGSLNGQYTWKVTYVYQFQSARLESLAGPPTAPVTLINEDGVLTNIPESPGNSDIVNRRIYRTLANQPDGPWFFVAQIPATNAALPGGYTDSQPDTALTIPEPGPILGNASAGDDVNCSQGCPTQVDGVVTEQVRDVLCPAFLPPPCNPDPNNGAVPLTVTQTSLQQEFRYGQLYVGASGTLTINTLDDPTAELRIHVSSVELEQQAKVVVTGAGKVLLFVSGAFVLGQQSWFGVDAAGALVWPADRIQILSCADDPAVNPSDPGSGTYSVVWNQQNRVSALVFAPSANLQINQAGEFSGSLYGRFIHIHQATGFVVDQGRGVDEDFLRAAFQYVQRWYDDPRP